MSGLLALLYQRPPVKPQPSLRDPARVGAFGPQKLLILSDVQMIHRQTLSEWRSFAPHYYLVQTHSKPISSPNAASTERSCISLPGGSPALLRCLPEQSLPKPSSFIGPKLDCIRHSLAWQPVTCTFLCGLDRETIPLCKACPHPGGCHCIRSSQKQLPPNFKHGSLQHC